MTTYNMTHTGSVIGNNACAPDGYKRRVKLRETKLHWIEESGMKWSKGNYGQPVGSYRDRASSFPIYKLDLESICKLDP